QAVLVAQPVANGFGHRGRQADQVGRDEDRLVPGAVLQGERLGVQVGDDFLEGLVAIGVAGEEDRRLRPDLHLGKAGLPVGVGGRGGWTGGEENADSQNDHDRAVWFHRCASRGPGWLVTAQAYWVRSAASSRRCPTRRTARGLSMTSDDRLFHF